MCLKIQCDGKSKKFYKFFWELNRALGNHVKRVVVWLLVPYVRVCHKESVDFLAAPVRDAGSCRLTVAPPPPPP
jgi:hypothetical protein